MIDKVFEKHHQLDWQKLNLPLAEHFNGLKDFPNEYKPGVEFVLSSKSSRPELPFVQNSYR
jgi:hypothetical protein